MAIRIKLGDYQSVQADVLGREWVGYFPRMTQEEAWEAGRGVWKMNRERAGRQRFALVVGGGQVQAAAEITGLVERDDRLELLGDLLTAGHPVYDAYLGRPDPVNNGSQNPVAYLDLAEEAQFLNRPCACGCGETTNRDFRPGHDVRAIQARVRDHFGGSALRFIEWIDGVLHSAAVVSGKAEIRS